MKRAVKRIDFRLTIKGNGVVNYDGSYQKEILKQLDFDNKVGYDSIHKNDNISYAKKVFTDSNDMSQYKLKISSNCLRNAIFGADFVSQSPSIIHHPEIFMASIATPASIIRGFLFANKKETNKRSGAITILDAIQTCNAKSIFETQTRSGFKDDDKEKATKDNTFFMKETVGEITYESRGIIDIEKMQFISTDQLYDRFAFNPDSFPIFKKYLQTRIPSFDSELAYYVRNGNADLTPEYGIMFSNSVLNILIKESLIRIASFNIHKANSLANLVSFEIRPVYDCLDNNEEWITIVDKDVDGGSKIDTRLAIDTFLENNINEEFYIEKEKSEAVKICADMKKSFADFKQKEKDDKAKKSEDAKKAKLDKAKNNVVEKTTTENE